MLDYLGNEIEVGDRIVWPGRQGSSLWMNQGVVLKLDTDYKSWGVREGRIVVARKANDRWEKDSTVYITEYGRAVVIEKGAVNAV